MEDLQALREDFQSFEYFTICSIFFVSLNKVRLVTKISCNRRFVRYHTIVQLFEMNCFVRNVQVRGRLDAEVDRGINE